MESRRSNPLQQPHLDQYELLDEVGHGGMATVYRARDPRLDREVAVKIIHRHLRENPEVAARFTSEAKAVAKLRHPNIVEVFDVSREEDSERFLVVELISGITLRALLAEHRELPPEIAVLLVLEVVKALEHAHGHGVVHRDIKPENVLVELPGTRPLPRVVSSPSNPRPSEPESGPLRAPPKVKLTDFGIAKVLDAQGVTSTGQVLGSPAHMAPEQIECGEVDERADVFGIGVLLYEALVGHLPFVGRNPAQVLRRVLDGLYEPAVKERPQVGAQLSAVVDRALAKAPEERTPSAQQVREELTNILEELGFEDPERELGGYFAEPLVYREEYTERIVARLSALATRAHERGDVVRASQLWNRALAFKPGDAALLKQVTGLSRRAARRRVVVRTLGVVAGCLGLGALAFGVSRGLEVRPLGEAPSVSPSGRAPEPAPVRASVVTAEPTPTAPPPVGSASAPRTTPKRVVTRPEQPAAAGATRLVQVVIQGPAAGTASVDGAPAPFGKQFPLSVGPHRFSFAPTDEKCCAADPPVRVVNIEAGEGVQVVYGRIKAREATLSVSGGEPGATLTCPALFPGAAKLPMERQIPMSQMRSRGACTLTPPEGSDRASQTRAVQINAGQVTTLQF
ncbi:MAG: serine/threonine protein kinase [Polyangiaceae bacterium]|nr:serine/threonine protein kinase [Polyangiaceae bacterium]